MTDRSQPEPFSDAARTSQALFRRHKRAAAMSGQELPVEGATTVQSLPEAAYRLPGFARKVLGREGLAMLQEILDEVRSLNEDWVGLPDRFEGMIALASEPNVAELHARLRSWADRYVAGRLSKPSRLDFGDPVMRFHRLIQEDLPMWLDELAHAPGTVHSSVLHDVCGYIPWLAYQATFASWFVDDPNAAPLDHVSACLAPTPIHEAQCREWSQHFGWHGARDVERVVALMVNKGVVRPQHDVSAARERLRLLASELREMRPFVVADFNPVKCGVDLAPGLSANWEWGIQKLGNIVCHADARERALQLRVQAFSTVIGMAHDGRLFSATTPWIDVDSLAMPEEVRLGANLIVAERFHERIFDIFARIDFRTVLERVRKDAGESAGSEPPTVEAVAATLATLEVEPGPEATPPEVEPQLRDRRPRIPAIRFSHFSQALGRIGCDVRPGKGSEIYFHRAGRGATLGKHLSNPMLSPIKVQRVLQRLGITLAEFLRVFGR